MKLRPLIIFHGGCYDGIAAAWCAQQAYPDAELHPGKFGEPPPDVTDRAVFVLDFSYPRETMIEMNRQAASLVVLDHHKTAEADCEGLEFCQFDMEQSGAGMAWAYFLGSNTGDAERPQWIDYVEDRDLWRFRHSNTKAFNAWFSSYPVSLATCALANVMSTGDMLDKGDAILHYTETWCDRAAAEARFIWFGTKRAAVVNVPYQNASEMGHFLLQKHADSVHFTAGYFQRADGRWQYSLRSDEDHDDVSEIAKMFGGGGHRNAAGFDVASLDQFEKHRYQ